MFTKKSAGSGIIKTPVNTRNPGSAQRVTLRSDKPVAFLQLVDANGRLPPLVFIHPGQDNVPIATPPPPQQANHLANQIAVLALPAIVDEEEDEMAESLASLLPNFTGTDTNASDWLAQFEAYCTYKNLNEATKIALCKLRMVGIARGWMNTLPETGHDTWEHLNESFRTRWFPKQFERHTMVRGLFNIRQEPNESVDTYVSRISQKAQMCGELAAPVVVDAAVSGLLEGIQAYVIENRPIDRILNLQDILTHGRIAEITRNPAAKNDSILHHQIERLSSDIAQMSTKLNKLSTASVTTPRDRSQSQSPGRRQVTFEERQRPQRQQSPARYTQNEPSPQRQQGPNRYQSDQNRPRQQWRNQDNRNDMSGYAPQRQNDQFYAQQPRPFVQQQVNHQQWQAPMQPQQWQTQARPQRWQNQQPQQQWPPPKCTFCGRKRHDTGTPCPMINQRCFSCGENGHSFRCCKSTQVNQRQQY
jgi:hypothetical protein